MLGRKITMNELDIIKEIKRNNTREQEVVQVLKREDRLTWEENKIVYMEGRVYIPNNKKTREKILKENHDSVDIRYPGQQRMLELIKQNYQWPGLKKDVKRYVQGVTIHKDLMSGQYYICTLYCTPNIRSEQTLIVFRIVVTLRSSYFILLKLSGNKCHLYLVN